MTVTDFNGCIDTLEVEVTEPSVFLLLRLILWQPPVMVVPDGWAAVAGTGGTEPYDYWLMS